GENLAFIFLSLGKKRENLRPQETAQGISYLIVGLRYDVPDLTVFGLRGKVACHPLSCDDTFIEVSRNVRRALASDCYFGCHRTRILRVQCKVVFIGTNDGNDRIPDLVARLDKVIPPQKAL